MATTQVELVTPTGTLFSGQAEMVVCRTEGGDIAFLAHHMAYVGVLEPYPLRIVHPDDAATAEAGLGAGAADELRFDVQGGFDEVNDNRVIVLCDVAELSAGTEPAAAMSPRHRLGVALLLDPPGSLEVDGLRRALGDTALGAVPAHVTLVPPVNVRTEDLGLALQVLRRAATDQSGPIAVELGPVTTFMPASPVVYLAVGGPDLDRLARLRQAVVAGPMLRPDHWPWVPHVTLTDDAPADRIDAARAALFSYSAATVFDRVVLLEEREHRWQPLADACLGRAAVVGRGGLELEIVEEARARTGRDGNGRRRGGGLPGRT